MITIRFTQLKVRTIVDVFTCITGVLCIVAVSGHIPSIYPLVLFAAMGLSVYLDVKRVSIPRWVLTVVSVAVILYFLIRIDVQDLIGHIMEALFVLLGIKFLERREVRDHMQIYALALFVLAGLGLMTLGMAFVAYLIVFFILLSLALIFLTFYSQDPELELTNSTVRTMITRCLWIPLLAIPLSAAMFVILPRTSYPILTFLNRPDKARAGFTDNVRLGQVSDIQEDERIIFRATMDRIDETSLYWRGITLDHFDGRSWRSTRRGVYTPARTRGPVGKMITQTIYLEPYDNSSLFALDKPLHVELRRARKNDDLTFTMPGFIERRIRYSALSALSNVIPEENIAPKTHLQLPSDLSPRVISLAKSLAVRGDRNATVKRVLDHLASDRYGYSLKDLPVSKNPLETFLFDSPRGNCEYFASAMAVLLRVNDIPSRLVGGYHGGYYNEMGGYYLIPQKNAHVWVEVHITGRGWVRFDPTPAGAALSAVSGRGAFLKLQMFLDTINYYWYGIVLTYNLERQISITRTIVSGLKRPSSFSFSPLMKKTAQYLALSAAVIGLVLLAWFFITSMKRREMAVLDRFLKRLEARGYEKHPSEGLEEFLRRVGDDDLRTICLEFAREFERIYYGDARFTADDLRRLDRLADKIDDVERRAENRMADPTPGR